MAEKTTYIDGMPIKTIIGILESKEAPEWLKRSWEKKLKRLNLPHEAKKLKKML